MAKKLLEFIKRERLYIVILLFLISIQILFVYGERKIKLKTPPEAKSSTLSFFEEDLNIREKVINSIARGKNTFAITILFGLMIGIVLSFVCGFILLLYLMIRRFSGAALVKPFIEKNPVRWDVMDIVKILILLLFLGYSIHIAEAFLIWLLRIKTFDNNFYALLNTAFIDTVGLLIIFYFVLIKYKERLVCLGITFKDFLKAVYTGILGYIAFIPILIFVFIIVIVVSNILNYKPQPQPIFEMFFEEKRTNVLTCLIILISIIGPIAEETFFRGFAYNALKRRLGVISSTVVTSAVFALLHANIVGFFPIMCLGFLLTYLYEKSGSLIPSITVHIVHNSILTVFMLAIKELTGIL